MSTEQFIRFWCWCWFWSQEVFKESNGHIFIIYFPRSRWRPILAAHKHDKMQIWCRLLCIQGQGILWSHVQFCQQFIFQDGDQYGMTLVSSSTAISQSQNLIERQIFFQLLCYKDKESNFSWLNQTYDCTISNPWKHIWHRIQCTLMFMGPDIRLLIRIWHYCDVMWSHSVVKLFNG